MIEIGDKIDDRYRITSRIAHGGMADVYEAYDLAMRRITALKVMREDMMGDPKNIERFNHECDIAAQLNRSKYVVEFYGSGMVDGRPYMANEYVEGRTLRDKLNIVSGHNLPASEACEVMIQLASGIAYVHSRGVIHRDIKPDNLFLLSDNSVKITDFGIASRIGEKQHDGDGVAGTVYYCAPEVLMGQEASIASDIYSLGVVFYEMLTGTIPFDEPSAEEIAVDHIKKKFPEPSKRLSSITPALDRIVIKACRKRPEERYTSALMMRDAIANVMKDPANFKEKKSWIARLFGFK